MSAEMNGQADKQDLDKAQWLADLCWAVQSPLMIDAGPFNPCHPTVQQSLFCPNGQAAASLVIWDLHKRWEAELSSQFLGPYFESLWSSMVSISNNLELIAQNLQIHHSDKTQGEFDFLLRAIKERPSAKRSPADKSPLASKYPATNIDAYLPEIIHQEIAVKFYLGLPDIDQKHKASAWLGPNLADRLDLKLFDMLTRQIKLSEKAGIKEELTKLLSAHISIDTVIKPEIVVKGYLFHPYGEMLPLPGYVNPLVRTGQWLTLSELARVVRNDNSHWLILPKRHWLAKALVRPQNLLTGLQLVAELQEKMATGKPQLIARIGAGANNSIAEVERLMTVTDQWQALARATLDKEPVRDVNSAIYCQ